MASTTTEQNALTVPSASNPEGQTTSLHSGSISPGIPLTVQLLPPAEKQWSDPRLYAPALPGILVALLAIWLSHRLTQVRERRKEIRDACSELNDASDEAEKACGDAWALGPGDERLSKVLEAKSSLQKLGTIATDLHRRTDVSVFIKLVAIFSNRPLSLNVINEVAALRDIATSDPFEDTLREALPSKRQEVSAAAITLHMRVTDLFRTLYG